MLLLGQCVCSSATDIWHWRGENKKEDKLLKKRANITLKNFSNTSDVFRTCPLIKSTRRTISHPSYQLKYPYRRAWVVLNNTLMERIILAAMPKTSKKVLRVYRTLIERNETEKSRVQKGSLTMGTRPTAQNSLSLSNGVDIDKERDDKSGYRCSTTMTMSCHLAMDCWPILPFPVSLHSF